MAAYLPGTACKFDPLHYTMPEMYTAKCDWGKARWVNFGEALLTPILGGSGPPDPHVIQ